MYSRSFANEVAASTFPYWLTSFLARLMASGFLPAISRARSSALVSGSSLVRCQAHLYGFGTTDHAPGEIQLLGHVESHQAGQDLRQAHVWYQAPANLQHRHHRLGVNDADVGSQSQLASAAQRAL